MNTAVWVAVIIFGALVLLGLGVLIGIGVMLLERTKVAITVSQSSDERLNAIEQFLAAEFPGGEAPIIYKSADGKYTGSSLEEVMDKMANDPDTPLNESDINSIRHLFENFGFESPKAFDPSKEDDDEDDEPWKRGGPRRM